jgi:ABC-type polysaccharide/polyol phosphate transport system ATPase subunit
LQKIQIGRKEEMQKDDVAIRVEHVHKSFNVFYDRTNTIKEKVLFWRRGKKEVRQILKDVDLEIKKGEVVGLIGVNGSGKSTLLKLMTKIIYPNKGKVETNGKLTSLLELGAGFHPDFSGRENIYFNASIFGLTRKEIDKRMDKIIEFSELQDFIDNPVRTYSSGMYMRLAFSVAINVDADILLLDEILSVGDQHFQEKCFKKIEDLKQEGKTIVFVTHGMEAVNRFCTRAVWLHQGVVKMDGDTKTVVNQYLVETA